MSAVRIRVAGKWLDDFAAVGDVVDSTIWRLKGYSGDYELSFRWAPYRLPSWFRTGATVEVTEGGLVTWRGFLGEPGDETHAAFGDGADAANYRSNDPAGTNMNTNVSDATTRGMRWSRYSNDFTGGSWTTAPGYVPIMMDTALDRVAGALGKVWYVTCGVGSLRAEKNGVDFEMAPDSTFLGVTDENYITALSGFYVSGLDGAGNPNAWSYFPATTGITPPTLDPVAADRIGGAREAVIDYTALGQLTVTQAQNMTQARFAQVGARAGFTNSFEMTRANSRRAGRTVAAPLSVRAGDRILIPGVTDMQCATTYGSSVTVTAQKVTRYHAEDRAAIDPVGLVERDYEGALAAAQPEQSAVEVL